MPGRRDRWLYRLHVHLRIAVLPWPGTVLDMRTSPQERSVR